MTTQDKVHCAFSFAGCQAEFLRDNQEKHMEQNTQKHLALTAAATLRLQQDQHQTKKVQESVEKKLEVQREMFEKRLQKKDLEIKELEQQLKLGQKIEPIQLGILPFDITFSNYREVKKKNELIDSPPLFTHPGGYKINLRIRPNGFLAGKGTHLSIWFNSLKCDYDIVLKIPVKFTITLQLLNQHRDQDHVTTDIQCEVTKEKAGSWRFIGAEWELIPHADLEWNDAKQTQYLKDDCLRFRITKIVFQ